MFRDRQEAGRKLGVELEKLQLENPIVLALPRGGVPVAAEVARVLNAPLDLAIVRKVGAPENPELAVAAIRALKRRSALEIVVALPVAPPETLTDLAGEADWTVCLSEPVHFRALSQNYLNFPQLSDDDVIAICDEAARTQNANACRPKV